MPSLPAFCDTCGTAFPSGFVFENSTNVTLSGNKSGPCPNCGGMGHIPDGVFNFVGSTIEILSAPKRTVKELNRLAQVAAQIKQELPELSSLANLLPKNREELYGFLALILAAIQLLTQSPQSSQNITINVSQVVEQTLADAPTAKAVPPMPSKSRKIGRNEPCPCGSGKKFKKCCGSLQ
jgi:hypothetical protein